MSQGQGNGMRGVGGGGKMNVGGGGGGRGRGGGGAWRGGGNMGRGPVPGSGGGGGGGGGGSQYGPPSGPSPTTNMANGRSSGPTPSPGFKTDRDIAAARPDRFRDLQPWQPEPTAAAAAASSGGGGGGLDDETFGGGGGGVGKWDQFAANAKLMSGPSDYREELYTTKLDRTGKDFKARELKAQQLADEILNTTTNNPHIAEERGQKVEDEMDEESKYSGVIRSGNAYVPPGARRNVSGAPPTSKPAVGPPAPAAQAAAPSTSTVVPPSQALGALKIAENTKNQPKTAGATSGTPPPAAAPSVTVQAAPDMAKTASGASGLPSASPQDVIKHYRTFVENEREKVDRRKSNMAKSEREQKLADLVKFGKTFKVSAPVPEDLVPILSKRSPATSPDVKLAGQSPLPIASANGAANKSPSPEPSSTADVAARRTSASTSRPPRIVMHIPEIPPFGAKKNSPQPPSVPIPATSGQKVPVAAAGAYASTQSTAAPAQASQSPSMAAAKLNPAASAFVFKPNPNANSFQPGGPSREAAASAVSPVASAAQSDASKAPNAVAASSSSTSVVAAAQPNGSQNPFFAGQSVKRVPGVNVREDFNPLKAGNPPDPRSFPPAWPFHGMPVLSRNPYAGFPGVPGGATFDDETSTAGSPHFAGAMPPGFQMPMSGPFGGSYRGYPMGAGMMAPPPGAMHLGPAGSGQYPPIVPQGMYVQPGTAGGQPSFHPQQNLTPNTPYANLPPQASPSFAPHSARHHPPPNMYYMQGPPSTTSHPASPAPFPATPQSAVPTQAHGPPPPAQP